MPIRILTRGRGFTAAFWLVALMAAACLLGGPVGVAVADEVQA